MLIEKARKSTAKFLDCSPHQIVFNSGSTEGISSVFLHTYFRFKDSEKNILLISDTEHAAPINEAEFLQENGFEVIYIPTKSNGLIDDSFLEQIFSEKSHKIALVSVMAANNETGVIQPYEMIGDLCNKKNIPYLCDTTQILGKSKFSFVESQADFITLSGHKLGALPGVGALIIKSPETFTPTIHGGNQENGLRGGTQNYIGIESVQIAVDDIMLNQNAYIKITKMRDEFEKRISAEYPDIVFFGKDVKRIGNTSFLSMPKTSASIIQDELQFKKIYITTSSACSDQASNVSRVLEQMNVSHENGSGAIRISFCSGNTNDELDFLIESLVSIYKKIKQTH